MIYDVDHVTTYDYGARVSFARCLLHLEPREETHQRVISSAITIDPPPAERRRTVDFFGNPVVHVRFGEPHARLVLHARSRVRLEEHATPDPGLTPTWESVRLASHAADLGPQSPIHFLFGSRHAALVPAATAYAAASFPAGRPVLVAALDLNTRIYEEFTYDSAATDVSTPVTAVLDHRRGVCQDFAHLMIAGLRGLGIPACYVSGYLRTRPPPGRERLAGADASHAWVAVWCGPVTGWVGLDPTNAVMAGLDHVVLARGRDYGDIAPVSGIILSSAPHHVDVAVDVVPLAEEPPGAVAV